MTTICDMANDQKKEIVRSIRFPPDLWEILVREGAKAHRTPAGQLRYFLECEIAKRGLIKSAMAAETEPVYETRARPTHKFRGGS